VVCAFGFDGTMRKAVHRLKYRGERQLAGPLVDAALTIVEVPREVDVLVPVPLHPTRLKSRGYNQALLLARRVAERRQLPVDLNTLQRVKDSPAQISVPPAARWENVRGAFSAVGRELEGKAVLLVDDVATTTGTLRAAASAARRGGARRVDAFVIARTLIREPATGTGLASSPV
jgi:ComF family protein